MCGIRIVALLLGLVSCLSIGGCDQSSKPPDSANEESGNAQSPPQSARESVLSELDGVHRVSGSPVTATLTLEPHDAKPGEEITLTVKLEIEPLWEVRALGRQLGIPATRLELEVPDGIVAENDWQASQAARSVSPDGHSVYVDEAVISRRLRVKPDASAGDFPVKCRLHYQACNDRQCLEPTAVELAATLKVE